MSIPGKRRENDVGIKKTNKQTNKNLLSVLDSPIVLVNPSGRHPGLASHQSATEVTSATVDYFVRGESTVENLKAQQMNS